jgi:HSP20 family molecular chaperone IbpA
MFGRDAGYGSGMAQRLPVNLYETTGAVVVVTPMPAVMADDVHVTLDGRNLSIRADCRTAPEKDYLLHEWEYGPYERDLELPDGYAGTAEASFGNGQLALRVEKGGSAVGPRDVPINTNAA